jgi:hypothetical protein
MHISKAFIKESKSGKNPNRGQILNIYLECLKSRRYVFKSLNLADVNLKLNSIFCLITMCEIKKGDNRVH